MSRVGFMTGTFDPPHGGHLSLVDRALQDLSIERFFVVVNVVTSHKSGASSYKDRRNMAVLTFAAMPGVTIAPCFLQTPMATAGPERLAEVLAQQYPSAKVYRILGGDSFRSIPSEQAKNAEAPCQMVVYPRQEDSRQLLEIRQSARVGDMVMDRCRVTSSTEVRAAIRASRRASHLSPTVQSYINRRNLYRG